MALSNIVETINTLKGESPVFFNLCDDVSLIRYFYSELIGLKENAYKKDSFVDYNYNCKTMMFYQADKIFHRLRSFSFKYNNEKLDAISWSIKVEEEKFASIVRRLTQAGIEVFNDEPEWQPDGYWSFPVLDPMGNKVEIYMEPKKAPSIRIWSFNLSANKKIVQYIYRVILKKLSI